MRKKYGQVHMQKL